MEASLILSILAIVGVGLTYWFLQQKLEKQRQRFRNKFEELENRQESRILEVIESLQVNYQTQLKQATEELTQQFESRLQETIKSLQENYQSQLASKTEELKQASDAQLQETINSLEERYDNQLQQENPLLVLEQLNENIIIELEDTLDDEPLVHSSEDKLEEEVLEPSSPEPQPAPVQNSFVIASPWDSDLEEEVVEPPSPEIQTTPVESFVVSDGLADSQLEEEVIPQSNQEIQQILIEDSSISTSSAEPDGTAQQVSNAVNKKTQELAEKIAVMGNLGQVAYIPKLREYINHPDSSIRERIASALGTIAASHNRNAEVQRAIPLLGKLSQAPEPAVRRAAVAALGNIKAETVIPFLKQSLRDSDRDVVKLASTALGKFKFYPINQGAKSAKTPAKTLKRYI
jgi:hypothetical protein